MYSDFALRTVLYTILCIGAIGISTGKLFAINHGISKYLAKKSDSGNFNTVKTTFISLGIEYVSIAIIALFISLCTINTIYTNAFFDELLPEFFSTAVTVFAIVVLGAECDFGLWLLFAIPYTFLIIANIYCNLVCRSSCFSFYDIFNLCFLRIGQLCLIDDNRD